MFIEHFELRQEKDEFETDGGGKLSPDSIKEDGTTIVVLRDGDEEINVTFSENENGDIEYELPEDIDEETEKKLANKINEAGITVGQLYKEKMELNAKKADSAQQLKAKEDELAAERAENARLKRELEIAKKGSVSMTDEDAKKFFGVDTVDEVAALQNIDYGRWMAGNARYAAQFATQPVEKTPEPERKTVATVRKAAPKAVDALGGEGKKPDLYKNDPFGYLNKKK